MLKMPHKKVAVVPLRDPDKIGSLYIPDQAKERVDQGLVKYWGAECEHEWKVGDHVLFSGYTGTLVNLEGEGDLIIMPEEFITAIIEEASWEVPGLFFRARDKTYFPATFEMAMVLCAQAYDAQRVRCKNRMANKPKPGEISWK